MAGTMTCESRDLKIKADESLAFCYSLNHIQGVMKGGQKTDMWMRSTTCLNKVNGKWLIVHEHASEPVDFESGKILTNLSPDKPLLH